MLSDVLLNVVLLNVAAPKQIYSIGPTDLICEMAQLSAKAF
jgi:hypothetical protein